MWGPGYTICSHSHAIHPSIVLPKEVRKWRRCAREAERAREREKESIITSFILIYYILHLFLKLPYITFYNISIYNATVLINTTDSPRKCFPLQNLKSLNFFSGKLGGPLLLAKWKFRGQLNIFGKFGKVAKNVQLSPELPFRQ